MRNILPLLAALFLLAGCTPTPTPEPTPNLTAIRVGVSPVVAQKELEILQTCVQELPHTVLFTEPLYVPYPELEGHDLLLWWGNPNQYPLLSEGTSAAFPLRKKSLVLLIHPENPLSSLQPEDAQAIFSGEIKRWSALSETAPEGDITVWALSDDHPVQRVFQDVFLSRDPLTPYAHIAPTLKTMLEAVQEDPGAIGFAPSGFPFEDLKVIQFQPQPQGIRHTLLGITPQEPSGPVKQILSCLQEQYSE
jgi:hypothetical protein